MIVQWADEAGVSPAGVRVQMKYIMEDCINGNNTSGGGGFTSGGATFRKIIGVLPKNGSLVGCQFGVGNIGTATTELTLYRLVSGALLTGGSALTSGWHGGIQTSNCIANAEMKSGQLQCYQNDRILFNVVTRAAETITYPWVRAEFRI